MTTVRAEFTNWNLADQAIAALKKEAIPLHYIRISEHSNYSAVNANFSAAQPMMDASLKAQSITDSSLYARSDCGVPHNSILVELRVANGDKSRAETLLHRWSPQQSLL